MTAYVDAHGTASISYNDLSQVTSNTDSQGNQVQYEYDELGRVTKVTPPQGTNYRTEYTYNKNGSLSQLRVYDNGSSEDTAYTYSTTSGKLTQRDFPTVSSANVRTAYAYDSAGRLQYETVTRESGGSTNLYRTVYAYSYASYHRQVIRTEQEPLMAAWEDKNRVTYKYDGLGRQDYEEREDWTGAAWQSRYDISQEYDKCGNRSRYHKNAVSTPRQPVTHSPYSGALPC